MKIAVICYCSFNYIDQAEVAIKSFKKQYPNAEYDIDVLTKTKDYGLPKCNHGKLDWCVNRFKVFTDFKDYDRVIMIDSDLVAVGNIDYLFSEELNKYDACAVPDYGAKHYYPDTTKQYKYIVNAGVLILNKSILDEGFLTVLPLLTSYNGTEQGYYTDYFHKYNINWKRLPVKYNYCLDNYYPQEDDKRVIHFTGNQPFNEEWHRIKEEITNEH